MAFYAMILHCKPGQPRLIEMNLVMNQAPGAGSIAGPVNQQSNALPLYQGCRPHILVMVVGIITRKCYATDLHCKAIWAGDNLCY